MPLSPGTQLGSFEISSLLGMGGMGEVYCATDTKLGREVAIKVLPEVFAKDKERLARFEREARLLASLNHPSIAVIYDLHETEGLRFLVMELVEGQTLADRIAFEGPMPVEDALPVFAQVAEALEVAHEQGIIHRDLKPANVMICPEGRPKILDFGLAKAFEIESSSGARRGTLLLGDDRDAVTTGGKIMGTPAYMSPEQARGQAVDKRTDIWAFGCCLYEALAGKRPFKGETSSDLLADILKGEPDWEALPAETPKKVRVLLWRCLQKDTQRRLRDIGEARFEISQSQTDPSGAFPHLEPTLAPPAASRWRPPILWGLAGLILGLVGAYVFSRNLAAPSPAESHQSSLEQYTINLPPEGPLAPLSFRGTVLALSPDGTRLVYVAGRASNTRLYLRPLAELEAQPMSGTEGAKNPFFSPDGQWVGFFSVSDGKLKKVSVRGGEPLPICDAPDIRGASWGADDTIVLSAPGLKPGLYRVSADGGPLEVLTTVDSDKGEILHDWPEILPGGKAILFTVRTGSTIDDARIAVLSLATGQYETVIEMGTHARYSPSGHVVYARSGMLLAVPFDLESLERTGSPTPVLDGMQVNPREGRADFSFSTGGLIIYAQSGEVITDGRELVWVDRHGQAQALGAPVRAYQYPRLSPDGERVVVSAIGETTSDLWIYDLRRGTPTLSRLTFGGDNLYSIWSDNGELVFFGSDRSGGNSNLFSKAADGSGEAGPLTTGLNAQYPTSISPDGRTLLFSQVGSGTIVDIWALALDGKSEPQEFLKTASYESQASFSPNGERVAYRSRESGADEIYVQDFPGPGGKRQISTGGGEEPLWADDGHELFYRMDDKMMSVEIETQPTFSHLTPKVLFEGAYVKGGQAPNYDVASDGRFLMIRETEETAAQTELIAVRGRFEEMERLSPTSND